MEKSKSWTAIEPIIRKVYLQLFSKPEVDAMIAFYGSTPAYHGVLELHGWGELGV